MGTRGRIKNGASGGVVASRNRSPSPSTGGPSGRRGSDLSETSDAAPGGVLATSPVNEPKPARAVRRRTSGLQLSVDVTVSVPASTNVSPAATTTTAAAARERRPSRYRNRGPLMRSPSRIQQLRQEEVASVSSGSVSEVALDGEESDASSVESHPHANVGAWVLKPSAALLSRRRSSLKLQRPPSTPVVGDSDDSDSERGSERGHFERDRDVGGGGGGGGSRGGGGPRSRRNGRGPSAVPSRVSDERSSSTGRLPVPLRGGVGDGSGSGGGGGGGGSRGGGGGGGGHSLSARAAGSFHSLYEMDVLRQAEEQAARVRAISEDLRRKQDEQRRRHDTMDLELRDEVRVVGCVQHGRGRTHHDHAHCSAQAPARC